MDKKSITINFEEGKSLDSLDQQYLQLVNETMAFASNAYAPYSQFHVSAGALLEDGQILKGTNVENASYPASVCAERTLLTYVTANFPKTLIKCIAVYVDKDLPTPVPPCGICRQTLLEAELRQDHPIMIILVSKAGKFQLFSSAKDLLPLSFDSNFLNA